MVAKKLRLWLCWGISCYKIIMFVIAFKKTKIERNFKKNFNILLVSVSVVVFLGTKNVKNLIMINIFAK